MRIITRTSLHNIDRLKPHFYTVKLGFTGVYIIFLISAQNIDCGYSLKPPHQGGSNEYPQSMFWAEIWKIWEFLSENFHFFLEIKFSIYLNRRVFVMFYHNAVFTFIVLGITERILGTWKEIWVPLKGSIFLKNRQFIIQERFNKLIYGVIII